MFKIFDYYCSTCETSTEKYIKLSEQEEKVFCNTCNTLLIRQTGAPGMVKVSGADKNSFKPRR